MKTKIPTLITAAILFCSFLVLGANDHVIISQVLYDPINSDTYGEAIELYNPTDNIIDISNYIIKTSSSSRDATIPQNTFMQPHSYFLLADMQFDSYKDNQSWPSPDYQESITLANTNAGVALVVNNQTIDAVGWGNSSLVSQDLFETAPAIPVQEGHSLSRLTLTDTDNNLNDFSNIIPLFYNSTSLLQQNQTENNHLNETETNESNSISMELGINNSSPQILAYSFSEDALTTEGYQILPNPGKNKTIKLSIIASDKDGFNDIGKIQALFNNEYLDYQTTKINETAAEISFQISLQYYLEPDNYIIQIIIADNSNESSNLTAEFEYLPILSLDVDAANLNFNENTNTILGDLLISTKDKPTIVNTGNTVLSIGLSAENFTSGNSILPANILSYGFNQTQEFPYFMKNQISVNSLVIEPTKTTPLSFKITIPDSAVKGMYSTKVLVTGVAL